MQALQVTSAPSAVTIRWPSQNQQAWHGGRARRHSAVRLAAASEQAVSFEPGPKKKKVLVVGGGWAGERQGSLLHHTVIAYAVLVCSGLAAAATAMALRRRLPVSSNACRFWRYQAPG
jgi:hypothetical protein